MWLYCYSREKYMLLLFSRVPVWYHCRVSSFLVGNLQKVPNQSWECHMNWLSNSYQMYVSVFVFLVRVDHIYFKSFWAEYFWRRLGQLDWLWVWKVIWDINWSSDLGLIKFTSSIVIHVRTHICWPLFVIVNWVTIYYFIYLRLSFCHLWDRKQQYEHC